MRRPSAIVAAALALAAVAACEPSAPPAPETPAAPPAALAATGAATAPTPPPPLDARTLTVVKHYEACYQLLAGDVLRYEFTADGPLDFNVHYHVGGSIEYPVQRAAATADRGQVVAAETHVYCVMWTAGAEEVDLQYRVDKISATAAAPVTP